MEKIIGEFNWLNLIKIVRVMMILSSIPEMYFLIQNIQIMNNFCITSNVKEIYRGYYDLNL